jgi:AcrR family transcriptional regulator
MSESSEEQPGGLFRDRVQSLVRSSILDVAWERAAEVSWSQVRMADLADEVGVSRQTIYNEFGSKDDLVLALFEREKDRFLAGFEQQMTAGAHFDAAMRASIMWLLDEVLEHRVLSRMVADARAGSTDGLIPLLTVHSDAIIKPVREQVVQMLMERWPKLDREAAQVSTEHTVRFILGQLVTPTDLDRDRMVDGILAMTMGLQPRTVS